MGDAKLRVAVNLVGSHAMSSAEFFKREPAPTLGLSLAMTAPIGQYDQTKLINIGSNRWAIKPELGFSYPVGRWQFDVYAGVWLFTRNDAYVGDTWRDQAAIRSAQVHVSYTVRPRLWVALDATHYSGGETTVGGVARHDARENTRVGLTCSLPAGRSQSLKLAYSEGASTRRGSDFRTIAVAWQYTWIR
jgi:hypothetical protein